MSDLTATIRKFADTPETNDCVKFYRSDDPDGPIFCFINGVGSRGATAEDALSSALAVRANLAAERDGR